MRDIGAWLHEIGLGEHRLKGILEPVGAWRVTGPGHLAGRFDVRTAHGLTPLRGRDGDTAGALAALNQVIVDIEQSKERFWEAELHRLIGRLQLQSGDRILAEQHLRHANDTACAQGARSWQLRAANSLAWYLADNGDKDAAHEVLEPVYNWFTEGFETADLKEARNLMERIVS